MMKMHALPVWTFGAALAAIAGCVCLSCASAAPRRTAGMAPHDALAASSGEGFFPGIAASVIRGGESVFREAVGFRKRGAFAAVSESDAFHIGSNTKAMTALCCGILVDRGLLRWSSTIGEILGAGFPLRDEYRGVTLELLLSHRSGLPSGLPDAEWRSFFGSTDSVARERERMAKAALARKPVSEPGSAFLYSNFNYVVAGLMLEKASGKAWEDFMREELFAPLGMTGAGFGPPASPGASEPDAPWGHSPLPVDPGSLYADNPAALGPAGTVHAALADIEAYVGLYFRKGTAPDGRRVIGERTLEEIMAPRRDGYALGWGAGLDAQGRRFLAHDGSNTMYYCSFLVFPDSGDAILILANRGDGESGRRIGELVSTLAEQLKVPSE